MGVNKKYSGYESWDYLRETRDFREFELIEGHSQFEPYLLSLDDAQDRMPVWAPEGQMLTFLSSRGGNLDVWSKPSDGTGSAELVLDMEPSIAQARWSPSGDWLVLRTSGTGGVAGGRDIHGVRPGIDSVPMALLVAEYDEVDPDVSRDGRWLAYTSNETGSYEVYVRPFPEVDSGRWQISVNGGFSPQWAHNGRELFFIDSDGNMMVVDVETDGTFQNGVPDVLFAVSDDLDGGDIAVSYDVSPDDQRFLMARTDISLGGEEDDEPSSVILVNNFFEELKRRGPN